MTVWTWIVIDLAVTLAELYIAKWTGTLEYDLWYIVPTQIVLTILFLRWLRKQG